MGLLPKMSKNFPKNFVKIYHCGLLVVNKKSQIYKGVKPWNSIQNPLLRERDLLKMESKHWRYLSQGANYRLYLAPRPWHYGELKGCDQLLIEEMDNVRMKQRGQGLSTLTVNCHGHLLLGHLYVMISGLLMTYYCVLYNCSHLYYQQ